MDFNESFKQRMDLYFPKWREYENSNMLGRYIDDSSNTSIHYKEILSANSLEQLKERARCIEQRRQLRTEFNSGSCYTTTEEKRKAAGCPRCYAQMTNNMDLLASFSCEGVDFFPDCPKYKTSVCWDKFDTLGFTME